MSWINQSGSQYVSEYHFGMHWLE